LAERDNSLRGPFVHKSVLLEEALKYLNCNKKSVVLDCTIGCAGHAFEILKIVSPKGMLIGMDADKDSVEEAEKKLRAFYGNFRLFHGNFADFDRILNNLNIKAVDAMLFDFGISSFQLDDNQRGFSFNSSGPLDMRIDRQKGLPLWKILEVMTESQIGTVIKDFGEERHWRRIARAIIEERRISPIRDGIRFAEIVENALGSSYNSRINPATKTFQAFRIFINDELGMIKKALSKAPAFLSRGGRIVTISFHSLEDRIVKHTFKTFAQNHVLKVVTKKPIEPGQKEISQNPRSRSAKLRSAERI
jgi:16S rRNA (cytosine1402-N4)-methyltransferase